MKPAIIPNFVSTSEIEIGWFLLYTNGTPLVNIKQNAGSSNFLHSMTPEQARHMARALTELADCAELAANAAATEQVPA